MIYLALLIGFLKVGCFSFGGAYAAIPLIREVVLSYGWVSEEMLTDMIAVSESTPGPIMVNLATYVGSSQAGIPGAIIATLASILPAFVIILLIMEVMKRTLDNKAVQAVMKGLQACVTGMILVTGTRMFRRTVKTRLECAVVLIFFVLAILKVSPALLILAAIPFGWCYVWWQTRRLEQAEKTAGPDAESSSNKSESASKDAGEGRS